MSGSHLTVNGVDTWYDEHGPQTAPALLLISGAGSQAVNWELEFCDLLVHAGFRVIRYDLRDTGLSQKFETDDPLPYSLDDLANDTVALLDALGIERAHLAGRSLGGLIAQLVAIRNPQRVASLALISSAPGAPGVGEPDEKVVASLLRPEGSSREEAIATIAANYLVRGSKGLGMTDEIRFARATREYDRCYYPPGARRHMAVARSACDLTEQLRNVGQPTVIIHGDSDPLVNVSGGRALVAAIPGARSVEIHDMGHDLPPDAWSVIASAIIDNARRSHTP